jgi:N-acetylmuramoyl-L-alanine amidase
MDVQVLKRRSLLLLVILALITAAVPAQEFGSTVEFHFDDRAIVVPRYGSRVEVLPVLDLVGAEAKFSPSAGTWGVVFGDHVVQFAVDHKVLLVNGNLQEANEAPMTSPGGIALSVAYLDRWLLSPLGFHLEQIPRGYQIELGSRFADPVSVRPVAADFGTTTTLLLTLGRPATVEVESAADGSLMVRFVDATPHLDASVPFRSQRVRSLSSREQIITVDLAAGIGLLSWHVLDNPPRVTIELGPVRPTPTPAPAQALITTRSGPQPVVIDPGHGGDDIGAQSPDGLAEKNLTMAIARRLARILESHGHAVRLTRDGDQSRALTDRSALANRLEAPVFVSLHANASTVRSVTGAETYYMSLDRATDEAAAATAELENQTAQSNGARSPLDLILWDMAQAEVLNESASLALAVQGRLNARLGTRDRGVKQAPFVVLTGATMPAILVEVGFLSSPSEAERLAQPDYQQQLAEAIAAGIEDFVRP